ncbi:GIY-YIG nuclease family protein [Escherichia coli]|uniref:GIY-YIG nuclease family protein n=1 Tax=Escherichia coli TaxID=562 RepID=UPI000E20DED1|nr:GIY-YIG nuclease family protein [Escherichia coli]
MSDKVHYLYKLTCLENDKSYIGVTTNISGRFKAHCSADSLIGCAIRKYGISNFSYDILATGDRAYIYDLEAKYIESHGTGINKGGYNVALGGLGVPLSPDLRKTLRKETADEIENNDVVSEPEPKKSYINQGPVIVANTIAGLKGSVSDFLNTVEAGTYAAKELFEMYQQSKFAIEIASARLFDYCMNTLQREFHPRIAFKVRKHAGPVEWIIR